MRYARKRGISVSAIVESYLDAVSRSESANSGDTPILRTLRGSLRKGDRVDYRRHLTAKYK